MEHYQNGKTRAITDILTRLQELEKRQQRDYLDLLDRINEIALQNQHAVTRFEFEYPQRDDHD